MTRIEFFQVKEGVCVEVNATLDVLIGCTVHVYMGTRAALSLIYTRKLEAGPVGDYPNRYMHKYVQHPPPRRSRYVTSDA